ncbi:hypothetical protein BCR42DRAFT_414525 [Absidia repens]|uniref:Uncharacterized protein n=1 Tax=Absidia repens TaxID=90262 RepID=A0A1X2IJ54_9FUNG|nr:hypothetical protein BCR42DRAFT_414525 [Absidia repens]
MANLKQPSVFCCLLPRPGIMLFTFLSAVYAFSGVFAMTAGFVFAYFYMPLPDTAKEGMFFKFASNLFKLNTVVDVFCGLIYVYAFILAYKRKWKAFEPVLYVFLAIALYGGYSMLCTIKENYLVALNRDDSITDKFGDMDDDHKESFNRWFPRLLVVTTLILSVMPWLIQVYLIKQIRSYIKYVLYKKDEKYVSSSSE